MFRALRNAWLVLFLLAGIAIILAAVHLFSNDGAAVEKMTTITVDTTPAGASVFDAIGFIGLTPLQLELSAGESKKLLLVKRGRQDREVTIINGRLRPRDYVFDLASAEDATLMVATEPAGAEIFLDGARLGKTPLRINGLMPGTRSMRITHEHCLPLQETIELAAGATTSVSKQLSDKIVIYYTQMIQKEPHKLTHYAELAHHSMLCGQYDAAAEALEAGYKAACQPGWHDPDGALAEEFHNIYVRYYIFPKEPEGHRIRPLCMTLMEGARQHQLYTASVIDKWIQEMKMYEKRH